MKTKTLIILFTISIGLNVALLVILIYNYSRINKLEKQSETIQWRVHKDCEQKPPMLEDLILSPEQELEMENEMNIYRSHIKIFADSMNIIRDSLFNQLTIDAPNEAIINKYIDSLVYFDKKMHQELVKHLTAIKSILDTEQYNIFLDNMKYKFRPHCKPKHKKYNSYEKVNEYFNDDHPCCGNLSIDGTKKESNPYSTPIYYAKRSRTTTKSMWLA
jgi:hypothetical protein